MRRKTLLLLLFGACGFILGCSTGWRMNINGTANGSDFARAITVTNKNDVVAARLPTTQAAGLASR
jgi:hypothetical protein